MKALNELFKTDEDFPKNIDNLWKTRKGLQTIYENRPDLKSEILPQLQTINNIIDRLIQDRSYHPNYGFY
ncbi:hypothetical protein F6U93_07870 [Tamlana haliotis]|uniref:Uncharacterized protein n=1 Tax=Pseudotamlana haliotis TaxID=2614804 RepID=A0A6N6MBS6_9FLAO|nr:hypothetical protein [Tamlana haliotis]KAB1068045.1 hypothetical protein F6U93_07870 [Tamlana haliotis]